MAPNKPIHSDSRRDLYEFEYPHSKIVVAKQRCTLGNHYHKLKDEEFVLVAGEAFVLLGGEDWRQMKIMEPVKVEAGRVHTFDLARDSILIGYSTKPYDPTDEYPVPA
jgi:quercetin dioxygenase-like cupin family protein